MHYARKTILSRALLPACALILSACASAPSGPSAPPECPQRPALPVRVEPGPSFADLMQNFLQSKLPEQTQSAPGLRPAMP